MSAGTSLTAVHLLRLINQRGHQRFRILAVDVGAAEAMLTAPESAALVRWNGFVVEETSERSSISTRPGTIGWTPPGELLWMSETDDGPISKDDAVNRAGKGQVTRGVGGARSSSHGRHPARGLVPRR